MKTTAKEISTWARESIIALSQTLNHRTLTSVYEAISRSSGISVSYLQKFGTREKNNPTQDTLDRLVTAIKELQAKV